VIYWRAVGHTHTRQFDQAEAELQSILDPAPFGLHNPHRRAILVQAWQLGLLLHDELRRRVGVPQLALPGRRMDAIVAVEKHLADDPNDEQAWALKRVLYKDLTEAEYLAALEGTTAAANFDHVYAQELGMALIQDATHWERGGEYLRMAARGMPALGPTIFVKIAEATLRAGNEEGGRHNYQLARRAGQAVGHKNLAEAERQAYFATVKLLGEDAMARGDPDAAIENYHLYAESPRSGVETLRTLATLFQQKGDVLAALRVNDQALLYNGKDPDLLQRRDDYYYSVMPEQLKANLEAFGPGFNVSYCLQKAKSILDGPSNELEWIDVAEHLARLVLVIRPEDRMARVLVARSLLRRGELDEAVALLEAVRTPRPEKFAGSEDEDGWYVACQLLGDLYLNSLGKPDLAIACLNDFRPSPRSGARTLYRLGQAYEQLGDNPRAVKYYQQVTAYEGNPLAPDAYDAIQRLQAG
jgi:tetratricopeptide (TPR) repeat protein